MKDQETVNSLYTDFRSDVIAAALVDNGTDPDKILVLRRRGSSRRTDKEITSVRRRQDYDGGQEIIEIQTNRPGMYDNLPEYLFHSGLELKSYNRDSVIDALRREEKTELDARRLFSVYEAEIEHTCMKIRLLELCYDRPFKYRALANTIAYFWPVLGKMDSQSVILFSRAIPHLKEIRNRNGSIAHTIATILGLPVAIKPGNCRSGAMKSPRLGAVRLGIDAALKGNAFETHVDVEATPGEKTIPPMLPGGELRGIMERLLEILLPEGTGYRIVLRPRPEAFTSRIGDPAKPCRLGVNTWLEAERPEKRHLKNKDQRNESKKQ